MLIVCMQMSRAKNWCFTINNPIHPADKGKLLEGDAYVYISFQLEEGKDGTRHYQGIVCFEKQVRLTQVKAVKGLKRAHLEVMRGTLDQAEAYVSKDDTRVEGPWKSGERPKGKGNRSDLQEAVSLIEDGLDIVQVAELCPVQYVKYHGGLTKLAAMKVRPRITKPKVFCFWGVSESGKSTLAKEQAILWAGGADNVYYVSKNNKSEYSWDGYTGQKAVIFNDFYGAGYPYSAMLNLLDVYPNKVRMLYGAREFTSEYIFFTSNKHPKLWYNVGDNKPLLRRFDDICEFKDVWEYNPEIAGIVYYREKNKFDVWVQPEILPADAIMSIHHDVVEPASEGLLHSFSSATTVVLGEEKEEFIDLTGEN